MMDFGYIPFWSFGVFMMIFWWGLLIWGFIAFIKWLTNDSTRKEKSAMDMAKERYARGEIDAKEFEEIKRNISESPR